MKARPARLARRAAPATSVACYFAKPSTRTRVSFEAAINRLGGAADHAAARTSCSSAAASRSPTPRACCRRYCAAIVIRTFAQSDVSELAAAASVPVINALTDDHHPCQALADLLTLRERFGDLDGPAGRLRRRRQQRRALADRGRRADRACDLRLASPRTATGRDPHRARRAACVDDPREAVAGARAVYTDVWVSMGEEAERATAARATLAPYRVTPELMALARAGRGLPALPARPPRRGGRRRRDRRARIARSGSRPPTGCRPSRRCCTPLVTGDWEV